MDVMMPLAAPAAVVRVAAASEWGPLCRGRRSLRASAQRSLLRIVCCSYGPRQGLWLSRRCGFPSRGWRLRPLPQRWQTPTDSTAATEAMVSSTGISKGGVN